MSWATFLEAGFVTSVIYVGGIGYVVFLCSAILYKLISGAFKKQPESGDTDN
ncbi:hypothetical protein GE107_10555 [Cohnella sp. CFH 77786]|uniref:hypothetical protein n=1 Tax=Cohnella sp. CFH 77786 TaxID=2662265 RepID=UPI001C60A458|nr:hypothetical protein [Cohnella sp. CFH 77786]MBW5446502.1 hypothetical protein [Cohnella sp. CFH 77786]